MLIAKDKYRITRKIQRRLLSIALYIHNLRQRYNQVIAIRVNFTYKSKYIHNITADDLVQHINQLENNTRSNKIFQHVIGYVLKLNMEPYPHIQALLFYNGKSLQEHEALVSGVKIARYWSGHITAYQGSGTIITGQEYFDQGLGKLDGRKLKLLRKTYIQHICQLDDNIRDSQGRQVRGLRKGITRKI